MEKTIDEIRKELDLILRDEITLRNFNHNYISKTISKELFLKSEVHCTKGLDRYDTIEDFLNSVTVGLIYNNVNSRIDKENGKITIYSEYLDINLKKYEDLDVDIYGLLVTLAIDEANHTHFFVDQFASALFNYCHTVPEINLMYDFLEDISEVGIIGKKMKKLLSGLLINYRSKLANKKPREEQRDAVETEINKIRIKTRNIEKFSKQIK